MSRKRARPLMLFALSFDLYFVVPKHLVELEPTAKLLEIDPRTVVHAVFHSMSFD
jgi:hypothetical protein